MKVDNKNVYDYPIAKSVWVSNRLLGEAARNIDKNKWDQLNAVLGPLHQVNLILVGFRSSDSMMAELQKAKWCGGKKNDLVLCYGPGWARVFGWSESDSCKYALEDLLLKGPIDNSLLPKISSTLATGGYKRRNWHDFDHIDIEPTANHWIFFLLSMFVSQFFLYYHFHNNYHCKLDTGE